MYCIYLTTYSGNKMPKFYIGSSSTEKINSGYHGSVKSIKYKQIWEEELKNHPELFKTEILEEFENRKDALEAELKLQIEKDVVKSEDYINLSLASLNGFFGKDMSYYNNPMYGRTGELSPLFGRKHSEERRKYAAEMARKSFKEKGKNHRGMLGKEHSQESNLKNSEKHKGRIHINNGKISKFILPDELDYYLKNGFIKGRIYKNVFVSKKNSIDLENSI